MRQVELTLRLPKAAQLGTEGVQARTYPVALAPTPGTDAVIVQGVVLAPLHGVAEIIVNGARTIIAGTGKVGGAMADTFRPLVLSVANLNTAAPAEITLQLAVHSQVDTLGGAIRFTGANPLGTSGVDTYPVGNIAGNAYATAQGDGFTATLVLNGPHVTRSIHEITDQTRVLDQAGDTQLKVEWPASGLQISWPSGGIPVAWPTTPLLVYDTATEPTDPPTSDPPPPPEPEPEPPYWTHYKMTTAPLGLRDGHDYVYRVLGYLANGQRIHDSGQVGYGGGDPWHWVDVEGIGWGWLPWWAGAVGTL